MEFAGWFLILLGIVGGGTYASLRLYPPPERIEEVDDFPLRRPPQARADNWVDQAIAQRASALVQSLPPPPTRLQPVTPETRMNTGNTPPEHREEHTLEHTPEHTSEHDDFGEEQWESVWRAIESGDRVWRAIQIGNNPIGLG